ncbi:hypothetical protein [Nevskia ramosa]|uniref:hypothetical protein n=1 Tax=Nevskia ramosa TaxID=64002 RepID=UPI0003B683B1|nr:hypothetical protein [Nevskia ramosa]
MNLRRKPRRLVAAIRPELRQIPGLFDFPAAGCRRCPDELAKFVESLIAPTRSIGAH